MKSTSVLVTLVILMFFNINVISSSLENITYNVIDFGAKPDGKTDSTQAFMRAWELVSGEVRPMSTIYVPPGRYSVRNLLLDGHDTKNYPVTFQINGTLVAPWDLEVIGDSDQWIKFKDVENVKIEGGVLEGHGATTLGFFDSNNIVIHGLTSLNNKKFHMVINGCHKVTLDGVKVLASGSANTYSAHIKSSSKEGPVGWRLKLRRAGNRLVVG
ncbi:hypothetical protein LguiB_018501 [Lonicera macranthoides]